MVNFSSWVPGLTTNSLDGTEQLPIVDAGVNGKVTTGTIGAFASSHYDYIPQQQILPAAYVSGNTATGYAANTWYDCATGPLTTNIAADTFTLSQQHGLSDGNIVYFTGLQSTTGVSNGTSAAGPYYYVRDSTTTSSTAFKVALTNGGAAINLGGTSSTTVNAWTIGPSITLTTGTSAMIRIGAIIYTFTQTGPQYNFMAFNISGATTRTLSGQPYNGNSYSVPFLGGAPATFNMSAWYPVTGLTAGVNTFTCKYAANATGLTPNYAQRFISGVSLG